MAFRIYILPAVGTGTDDDARRPKYLTDGTIPPASWGAMDYGFEPWFIIGADLPTADDLTVMAKADSFALPFNLDVLMTTQNVSNVQQKLHAVNIPAQWLDTTYTWRTMLRIVVGIVMYMQRFCFVRGIPDPFFGGAVTMETTIGSLPLKARQDLTTAADSLGLITTEIVGTTTIRQAFPYLADQMKTWPVYLGGIVI